MQVTIDRQDVRVLLILTPPYPRHYDKLTPNPHPGSKNRLQLAHLRLGRNTSPSREPANSGVGLQCIHMGYLRPQIPLSPAQHVLPVSMLIDVAPATCPALRAEKLPQPFIAEHHHKVCLNTS